MEKEYTAKDMKLQIVMSGIMNNTYRYASNALGEYETQYTLF